MTLEADIKNRSENNKESTQLVDDEIDLLEYISEILNNKYKIMMLSMLVSSAVFGFTFLMQERYESLVNLALVEKESLGGVAPDNRRAPEMMTLLEHDFITNTVYENYQERIMAKMRSRVFTEYFLNKNQLLPLIFHKHWDSQNKTWIDGYQPNMTLAARIFRQQICAVEHSRDNNLMTVRVSWKDPHTAAQIANQFVADFNTFMRNKAIEDANNKLKFLEQELQNTKVLEMRKSFYRLMEAQLVKKMLATNKKEYSLEVLDPAIPAIERASPAKKRMTALTFIFCVILCISFLIARVIFRKLHAAIKTYQVERLKTTQNNH